MISSSKTTVPEAAIAFKTFAEGDPSNEPDIGIIRSETQTDVPMKAPVV
jgi:hypothetical protein